MEDAGKHLGCALLGTNFCKGHHHARCESCMANAYARRSDAQGRTEEGADLQVEGVRYLLPEGHCAFCKQRMNGTGGYWIRYYAKPDPDGNFRIRRGKREKGRVELIPLELPLCKRCKRRILTLALLPRILPLAVGIAGLITVYLTALQDHALGIGIPLSGLLYGGALIASWILGQFITAILKHCWVRKGELDAEKLAIVARLNRLGWTAIGRAAFAKEQVPLERDAPTK